MVLKLQFLLQNCKNCPRAEGSVPSVTRLSSNGLFSAGPKLDNFCAKNIFLVHASSLLAKFWLTFWLHLFLQTNFSSDHTGRMRTS